MNRGGNWNNEPVNCRSANRNANDPSNANNNLGFRPVLVASPDAVAWARSPAGGRPVVFVRPAGAPASAERGPKRVREALGW